jgi:GxxExxY protein
MVKEMYPYSDVTEVVIGSAMKVHNTLGNGFPEIIYHKALQIELNKTRLQVQCEIEKAVHYEGHLIGKRRVDILINDCVLVELKALAVFDPSDNNQVLNYLEAFKLPVGLLINFGKKKLEFKRFINNKLKD